MSYIRAKKAEIEEGQASRDGAVHLELPDHGEEIDLDCDLDDEMLSFVLGQVVNLPDQAENEALVVWKVTWWAATAGVEEVIRMEIVEED